MSTQNTTDRQRRYLNHLSIVTDDPGMLRAVDVPRLLDLLDEVPPSFDRHDFLCWLGEQQIPPRAMRAVRDRLAAGE